MSVRLPAAVIVALLVVVVARSSRADDYELLHAEETTFELEQPRSTRDRVIVASLLGGAAVVGAVSGLFGLDAQRKYDEISVDGNDGRTVYTPELEATRRSAARSRNLAVGALVVSGSLVVAGIAAFIITAPDDEVVHVSNRAARAFVSPIEGGAMAGGSWSF